MKTQKNHTPGTERILLVAAILSLTLAIAVPSFAGGKTVRATRSGERNPTITAKQQSPTQRRPAEPQARQAPTNTRPQRPADRPTRAATRPERRTVRPPAATVRPARPSQPQAPPTRHTRPNAPVARRTAQYPATKPTVPHTPIDKPSVRPQVPVRQRPTVPIVGRQQDRRDRDYRGRDYRDRDYRDRDYRGRDYRDRRYRNYRHRSPYWEWGDYGYRSRWGIWGEIRLGSPGYCAPTPRRIELIPPGGAWDVSIWTDNTTYYPGAPISVSFLSRRDAYVYIFDTDTTGHTRQIFPNYYDQDNFAQAGAVYRIPGRGYDLQVSGPEGWERLEIVAVPRRYGCLSPYDTYYPDDPYPLRIEGRIGVENLLKQWGGRNYVVPGGHSSRVVLRPQVPGIYSNLTAFAQTSFYVSDHGRVYYDRDLGYDYEREIVPLVGHAPSWYQKVKIKADHKARVYIDGYYVGITSVEYKLPYGTHRIWVERDGYYPQERIVRITDYSKHRKRIEFDLRRIRS